jgi:transposase
VLDAIRVPRLEGAGRPRKRPEHLIADRGYSFSACRRLLRERGIPHTLPERRAQRERRAKCLGRPLSFDTATYARRNVVERCVNQLKQWRAVATRYEKRAANYRAMVVIAALMIWLSS